MELPWIHVVFLNSVRTNLDRVTYYRFIIASAG